MHDKLQKYNFDFCKNNLKEELLNNNQSRVLAAISVIGDLNLANYTNEILWLAQNCDDEIIVCESVLALKRTNALYKLNENSVLNRIQNEHIGAIISSYFNQ
jgi:hypothetical protein